MAAVPEGHRVLTALSVDDNLTIRLRTEAGRRAAKERFPILDERADQLAGLLSGGEQQQLAMAVALADPPPVFVADERFADVATADVAWELIPDALTLKAGVSYKKFSFVSYESRRTVETMSRWTPVGPM